MDIISEAFGVILNPLNSVLDVSLREILHTILNLSIFENLAMNDLAIVALKFLTFTYIFIGTVKFYVKVAYPNAPKTVEEAILRRKEIRFFMVNAALPISLATYNISSLTLQKQLKDRIFEEASNYTSEELLQFGNSIQNGLSKSGLLTFFGGQTPNWLILIILLLFLIAYYNPYNILQYIFNFIQIYSNTFIIFILLGQILMLFYFSVSFVLVQMALHNKIMIYNNLPKHLRSRLLFYSNLTNEEKNSLSRTYKINIYIYICLFIFTLIMYLLGVYD